MERGQVENGRKAGQLPMSVQRTDPGHLASSAAPPPTALVVALVASGLALLLVGVALNEDWARTIGAAAGVGLLAVGVLSGLVRLRAALPSERRRRAFTLIAGASPVPLVLSDLSGRVLAANPAAAAEGPGAGLASNGADGGPNDGATIESCIDRFVGGAAGGIAQRLARKALADGAAGDLARARSGGALPVAVASLGSGVLLWRLGPAPVPVSPADPPGLVRATLDAGGRVRSVNRPGLVAEGVDALVLDGPLRPGGLHVLAGSGAAVRCEIAELAGGGREVFLFPVDPAETAGLAPDRLLDHLPVGLARMAVAGELLFVNRAARALLGERAAPGANLGDLVEGLGRALPERVMDASRGRSVGRSEIARSRGEERDLFLQVALNRIVVGGEIGVMAVISDATEMKALEAQFVQSQKMQAVGQLAGGVAHDFNNLLTAISGHCDLLLMRHEAGDGDHGDLMQIRHNAHRAAALVRQLLAFSRKQTLRPRVLYLAETLAELSHLLNRLLGERVTLRIDCSGEPGAVRVDERQFEQVIMNLVVNARDAMPMGGEVQIVASDVMLAEDVERDRATVPAGAYVLIEVSDTGTGIPEEKLHKIFEPFYTTKKPGEGTGLGLSTVYGIVKQTGGFVFVSSVVGRGSTFAIYLPRHEEEAATAEAEVPAPPPAAPLRDLTGNGVVLLVEDEAPVRSFAARALRLRGYEVIEAACGEEALEIAADPARRIDLFVSDVVMPGIDGPGWIREARKTRPETRVILVSGYAEDVFAAEGGDLAAAVFVPKPFSLAELTQKVKEVLEGR